MTRRLPASELELEIRAQIEVVLGHGISLTHVDSHRHVHKLGPVREALAGVLCELGIERVRTAQDVWLDRPLARPTYLLGPVWRRRLAARFRTTDHFFMPSGEREGRDWPERVVELLRRLSGETIEVGVHPGADDAWRAAELAAVERFTQLAIDEGHSLDAWRAL